jgi:tripartite-type tricarboxylate transporter receptor subunit TctC
MLKRRLISCLALAAFAIPHWAAADNYPSRQIRLVVGFPAGQSSDAIARIVAQTMSADLKQNVWVDNKPGASGIIAHEDGKRAPADGYTLLFASTTTLNPSLFTKLP